MKSLGRLILPALAWLVALSAVSAKSVVTDITPPKSGKVTADRVNVRARASLIGERVTQLRKEDTVTVLATVKIDPPKEGEPAEWLKIAMPAGGQTWVHMAFVKEGKVTANKLNVRAGGSERFSIVAHLAKDDEVKEKRTSGDWIEIEHPEGAQAFVAASFVEIGGLAETVEEEKTKSTENTETTEVTETTETTEESTEKVEETNEETPWHLSGNNAPVFDEVTVKERIVVEGGDSGDILSSFDGPTTFNKSVKINNPLKVTGQTQLVSPLDSSSKESGSLVVSGGVGIGSNLFVAGENVAISTQTGAIIVENGGVGIAKSLHVGEGGYFAGIVSATSYYGDGTNLTGVEMPGGSIGTVFYDGNFVGFGASTGTPDMEIGHDSAHSIIRETGTGDLYLQSDGKVIISNTSASKVSIYCDTDDSVIINHNNEVRITTYSGGVEFGDQTSNGNIRAYGDITAYYSSDATLKDNVRSIDDPLEKVMQISGNTFTWKENDAGHEGEDTGVIAQEIEALGLPGIVVTRENGKKAVRYEKLVPLLIEAIKELNAKVEMLAATPDVMSAVGMINDIADDKNKMMEERLERQKQSKKDTGNPNQGPVGWSEVIPPEDGI